ncbi:MAG: helix-turn-helix transcriptional regulator [Alphaproteobacteria bacterium]|nr:helix-turn-helix transcriptional regulator [Alphaproteobacteria bacterium]
MISYSQFCPVAKASEIITTRWTPLVLRELIMGSRHFNDIHRGVPLMSRTLLSTRLKDLEKIGVVERTASKNRKSWEYSLTGMGNELTPIIIALGVWGQKWVESSIDSGDWDAGVLMWDIRRRIDVNYLPGKKTVIQFEFEDAPKEMRCWWIVIENGEADLCQRDPGFNVDLFVASNVVDLSRVWIGQQKLSQAIDQGAVSLIGEQKLRQTIFKWFPLAKVNEAAREMSRSS